MKKMMVLGFILSLVLICFSACDGDGAITFDEQSVFRFLNGNEIPINVQYIRTEYFYDPENPFPKNITIVSSTNEIEEYYEKHRKRIWDETGKLVPDLNFLNAIEKYNDNFFSDNFLVIIGITEGSGSIGHRVVRVYENGDILIKRLLPEAGTADMASWSIIIELKNDLKDRQFNLLPPVNKNMF